ARAGRARLDVDAAPGTAPKRLDLLRRQEGRGVPRNERPAPVFLLLPRRSARRVAATERTRRPAGQIAAVRVRLGDVQPHVLAARAVPARAGQEADVKAAERVLVPLVLVAEAEHGLPVPAVPEDRLALVQPLAVDPI